MRKALSALRRRRDDGASAVEYGLLVALIAVVIAATVVTLPIMVIALFVQKYVVSGLTAGATKG